MRLPALRPPGWIVMEVFPGCRVLGHLAATGLQALYSVDRCPQGYAGDGWYRHLSISRRTHYPTWDEMREFVRSCGWFDAARAVIMILPGTDDAYQNIHRFCFHWFQREAP